MSEKDLSTLPAIARVMSRVRALGHDGNNQQQRYTYTSSDKVLQLIGGFMAAEGVEIVPEVTGSKWEFVEVANKKGFFYADVEMCMNVRVNGETEARAYWEGGGEDYSTPAKAKYKAITSGHKYFLMKLFVVGTGNEDGEHENFDKVEEPPKRTTQPNPQPAKKKVKNAWKPAVEKLVAEGHYDDGNDAVTRLMKKHEITPQQYNELAYEEQVKVYVEMRDSQVPSGSSDGNS
jgi:hypothetical protein